MSSDGQLVRIQPSVLAACAPLTNLLSQTRGPRPLREAK